MRQEEIVVALCDDDREFLAAFAPQVREVMAERGAACDVRCYGSAAELRGGRKFSVLLLDVMMEGLDGMTLARTLRAEARDVPVIFVSSNRDTALYGYEVDALRFLSKPVEIDRLREALRAAEQKVQPRVIVVQTEDGLRRVELRNVRYAEMMRRGVCLHLADGALLPTRMRIGALELMLPERQYFRCHQGYIVNLEAVSSLLRTDAVLKGGDRVPVSRYRLAELREHFLAYLSE